MYRTCNRTWMHTVRQWRRWRAHLLRPQTGCEHYKKENLFYNKATLTLPYAPHIHIYIYIQGAYGRVRLMCHDIYSSAQGRAYNTHTHTHTHTHTRYSFTYIYVRVCVCVCVIFIYLYLCACLCDQEDVRTTRRESATEVVLLKEELAAIYNNAASALKKGGDPAKSVPMYRKVCPSYVICPRYVPDMSSVPYMSRMP